MGPDQKLKWKDHSSQFADYISSMVDVGGDVVLCAEGGHVRAHQAVLASASPLLADILNTSSQLEETNLVKIVLTDVSLKHVQQLIQFMYNGTVDQVSESEIEIFLEMTKHLRISGLSSDGSSITRRDCSEQVEMNVDDDDVFVDPADEAAVDLSPVPAPKASNDTSMLASRRLATLNKISEALQRSGSCRSVSSCDWRSPSHSSRNKSLLETSLMRTKKPRPLTNLPEVDGTHLKPGPPSSSIALASPDCKVLEEKFKNIIEGGSDPEKLRNLSVSSADFNFEGGSLPGTPSYLRLQGFIIPDRDTASHLDVKHDPTAATLDLSVKKPSTKLDIPSINVIKPEPEDTTESDQSLSVSGVTQVKCEPVWIKSDQSPPPNIFHGLSGGPAVPLQLPTYSYHPAPGNNGVESEAQSKISPENLYRFMLPVTSPTTTYQASSPADHGNRSVQGSTGSERSDSPGPGMTRKKDGSNKQAFKCDKCGKSYNWNYNLNRHKRFECGINNRFECAMCHKRFPYKQNAAIHLKRKHKLPIESADEMIAGGHIRLLQPVLPGQPDADIVQKPALTTAVTSPGVNL